MGNGGAEEQTEHGGGACDLIQKRIPVSHRSPDKIELLSFLPLAAPVSISFASFNPKSYSRKASACVAKQGWRRETVTDRLKKKETDANRGVRNVEMHERNRSEKIESESYIKTDCTELRKTA